MILPMARRMLAWLLVTPLAAVGVLAAHAAAYAVTRASLGEEHGYLEHAPQVAGLLASLALVGLALQERSLSRFSPRWVAPLAPLGFVCQEHIERLVHTGQLPFLLTSPTFLVGLALQLPVAAVCVGHMPLGQAQLHRQEHQVLLRAVVQVSLDPTALGFERVDQPAA